MAAKYDFVRLVNDERSALAEDLRGLTAEQWSTLSLCSSWTVRDVACHLAAEEAIGLPRMLGKIAAAGFSAARASDRDIARWRPRADSDIIAHATSPGLRGAFKLQPPGALSEVFLHSQDIRRPLGLSRQHPTDCLVAMAETLATKPVGTGAKKRIKGLRLRATDVDWSHGDGPEVTGPAEALILAAAGRRAALADLAGEGKETLAAR